MAKWYEFLGNWERPLSQWAERKFVPEKTHWAGIPLQLSMGSIPKQWQQKSKAVGDISSRGWVGPFNMWATGEEGKNAYEKSPTNAYLKKIGTVAAILGSIYGRWWWNIFR